MKMVRTFDLVAADLPNLESPFFAAEKARALILGNHYGPLRLHQLPGSRPSLGGRNEDRSRQVGELLQKIRNYELWLVCDSCDGGPFSPVIRWKEEAPDQGRWVLTDSDASFSLGYSVKSLNDSGVTPQQLARYGAGGIGSLPASNFAQELQLRRREEALQLQQSVASAQSPFPARSVAPLPSPATAPQSSPDKPAPKIHLEVGLFTDGTLNNADNSQALEDRIREECISPFEQGEISEAECRYRLGLAMGVSYTNAPSNVAKLADLYIESHAPHEGKITHRLMEYAPGIGTKTGDGDSMIGMATGLGEAGIVTQVERAFATISQRILELALTGPITTLTVDLFGFSRGAASARHAAHEINEGPAGALGQAFKAQGIDWPEQVTIRFVGLFDSVAAIINPMALDLLPSNGQNEPVKVYLAPNSVKKAVHLVAADEHRENFALNSLRNTDGSLPDNFQEIFLPGVHSDIGGGYGDSQREDILISPLHQVPNERIKWPEQSMEWDILAALKQQKEAEGWIGEFSLPVRSSEHLDPRPSDLSPEGDASLGIYKQVSEHPAPSGRINLALRMVRQIRGEYSRVSLRLMHRLASNAGVPLKNIPKRADLNLTDELEAINESLLDQTTIGQNANPTLGMDQLNLLRQRYIHYSAQYNAFKFMALGTPTTFRLFRNLNPNAPTQSGERIVHPNR